MSWLLLYRIVAPAVSLSVVKSHLRCLLALFSLLAFLVASNALIKIVTNYATRYAIIVYLLAASSATEFEDFPLQDVILYYSSPQLLTTSHWPPPLDPETDAFAKHLNQISTYMLYRYVSNDHSVCEIRLSILCATILTVTTPSDSSM